MSIPLNARKPQDSLVWTSNIDHEFFLGVKSAYFVWQASTNYITT